MTSWNKNGGDSVGTMYVGRMEDKCFMMINEIESGENIGETLKPYYT